MNRNPTSESPIQPGLPPTPSVVDTTPSTKRDEALVICPICLNPTESLKSNNLIYLVSIAYMFSWDTKKVHACPRCMRKKIEQRTVAAIPLSNVLFPFLALVYLVQWLLTFRRGHGDQASANAHRMTEEEWFEAKRQAISMPYVPRYEIWLLLGLLALLAGGFWWLANRSTTVEVNSVAYWKSRLSARTAERRLVAIQKLEDLGEEAKSAIPDLEELRDHDRDFEVRLRAERAIHTIDPTRQDHLLPAMRNRK